MNKLLILILSSVFSLNSLAVDDLNTLAELYPEQTKTFIKTRIDNSKSVHKFFRSFVRYYYRVLKDNPKFYEDFSSLLNHTGIVVGDAHVENFGFFVDKNNKSFFTINDFDDVDKNILFFDILRHLCSSLIVNPDLDISRYISNYKEGLNNEMMTLNKELEKLKNKSETKGHTLTDKDINFTTNLFKNHKPVVINLSSDQKLKIKKKLESILKTKFNKTLTILDLYKRSKDNGGSAGLDRYEVLVNINNNTNWIELKEMTDPAPIYFENDKQLKRKSNERLANIREFFLIPSLSDEFELMNFEGKIFFAKFIWDGELNINLKDYSTKASDEIIYNEVKFLGNLHRMNLIQDQIKNYSDLINETTIKSWKDSANKMIDKMTETFQNVRD